MHAIQSRCRSIFVVLALCFSIGGAVIPQTSKAQGATPVTIVAPLPLPVSFPAQIAVNIANVNILAQAIAQQINNIHPQVTIANTTVNTSIANFAVVAQAIAQQIAAVNINTNIVNAAVVAQAIAQQIAAVNLNTNIVNVNALAVAIAQRIVAANLNANIVNVNALAVAIAQRIVAANLNANIINVNALAVAIAQQIAALNLNANVANVNALATAIGQQVVIAARQEKTPFDARQEMDFPVGVQNITLSFPPVPANMTLVIHYVTVMVILPNGEVVDDLEIGTQATNASPLIYHIQALPTIVTATNTRYMASQPLELYAGPATTVQVNADRVAATGTAHLIVTLTGDLIPFP